MRTHRNSNTENLLNFQISLTDLKFPDLGFFPLIVETLTPSFTSETELSEQSKP